MASNNGGVQMKEKRSVETCDFFPSLILLLFIIHLFINLFIYLFVRLFFSFYFTFFPLYGWIHFLFEQFSRVKTRPPIGAQAGNVKAL